MIKLTRRTFAALAVGASLVAAAPVFAQEGKPHLIRIDTRSGHGSGKPVTKIIEEYSDVYAFLGYFTGLKP